MKKTIAILALLLILTGCSTISDNEQNLPNKNDSYEETKPSISDDQTRVPPIKGNTNNKEATPEPIQPAWLSLSCDIDSDCVSVTAISGCYYDCKKFNECGGSAPKCPIGKKTEGADCVIGHPCFEPKDIKCIENKCVGEW